MTPLDQLQAMRELLADPEHWTKGAGARSATGRKVAIDSPRAVRWCLARAAAKAAGSDDGERPAMVQLAHCLHLRPSSGYEWNEVAEWQDAPGRTHAEVLALLDLAIEKASAAR